MENTINKDEYLLEIFNSSSVEEIEIVLKNNPQFREMNFIQLKDNKDFQRELRNYRLNNQLMLSDPKALKSIKKMSSNLSSNAVIITDKELKHALTPYQNPHAYIQQLDVDFFQQLEFDPENGSMNIKGNVLDTVTLKDVKTRSSLKELDLPLLRSLYTTIYTYAEKIDTDTVTIYLPTLSKHLGINIIGDKPNELFAKIMAFEHVIGVFDNGSFYRLLTFANYDKQTNSITFSSPYMNKILRTLTEINTITLPKGKNYVNPHYSYLIHGTIASERNKPAIEIVNSIIILLHQRGVDKESKVNRTTTTPKKVLKHKAGEKINGMEEIDKPEESMPLTVMRKKISTIIREIPILKEALERPVIDKITNSPKERTARDRNQTLKRAFSKAYILLKTSTDAYRYFNNLTVTEIIPTISTIDQVIEISHNGINTQYKKHRN